jgi:4-amino-4-deoxy-L-arabinose transferase-like glycosyltransferase
MQAKAKKEGTTTNGRILQRARGSQPEPPAAAGQLRPATPPVLNRRLVVVGLYILVGLAALLPRVLDLGAFPDSDERNFWLGRSHEFLQALQSGHYADTAISTHPGVTTMWLGSAGILLRQALLEWGLVETMPYPLLLALMRLPVALVHTAGVLVGYALLRRIFPFALATLAALLWASDPFVIAYSRILHVDGLSTTFATLCLLAAAAAWHHTRHPGLLVLSAVCGALGVLSKSPALAVLPIVAGYGLWAMGERRETRGEGREARDARRGARDARRETRGEGPGVKGQSAEAITHRLTRHTSRLTPQRSRLTDHASRLAPLALWGLVFALTIAIVWPAVWADPLRVYELLRIGVEVEGGSPHVIGNFFLGEATPTPDWRYYPVALALRTTPITLAGLLLLPLVWRQARDMPAARHRLLLLVAFVVLFVLAMSLFPKKLNRYIVPIFPALDILAAAGIVWAIGALTRGRAYLQRALLAGVALAAWLNAAWWHPYGVVAFNQVFGGAQAGAQTFLLGDGEGLAQAADWLHQQPDITGVTIASTMINSFQPLLKPGVQAVSPGAELSEQVGYVLIYLRHTQRGPLREPFRHFYRHETPLHTVTIHGVEYVWLYQVPPPIENRLDARFGEHIALRGYKLHTDALTSTGALSLTVQWKADAPPQHDYLLFAHLLNAQGERVAQIDVPPGGPDQPASQWEPGRVITWQHPLPLPPDLPPGEYWLALGLYRPDDFARLPLYGAAPPPAAPAAGPDALLLPVPRLSGGVPE